MFKLKHFYYYIPPCPQCGSRRTGRYVRKGRGNSIMEEESLKHGEIIRFAESEPRDNAFCVDCDFQWPCTPRLKLLTGAEIDLERESRTTNEAYEEIKKLNREESAGKYKTAKGIWRILTGRKG